MAHHAGDFEVEIVADEATDDSHSEIGSSIASSSTSLLSSLLEQRRENGRTYHKYKEGKYNLPNDETELDRLDLVNELCRITLDEGLGEAPPCDEGAKVGRVLDVGTGTGIWAINFGDEHPEADILGIDLSPTQPRDVPPNVRFEIDDVEDEWLFSHPFDYIHSRFMTTSISDWPLYLRRCYDNLAPGGWLELQDPDIYPHSDDGTLKPGNNLTKWSDLLMEASKKLGAAYVHPPDLKALLIEAGFEDVRTITHKWPTNSWPKDPKYKELGIWNHENFLIGLESLSMAPFTRALEWTPEEVRVFLIDVRKDGKDRGIHAYWPMYYTLGRKPLKKEDDAPAASPAAATPADPALVKNRRKVGGPSRIAILQGSRGS